MSSEEKIRIYEGASLTVKGEVAAIHVDMVEDVTFKFFVDGAASTECADKTIPMSQGTKDTSGNVVVTYTLRAPDVPADKESYIFDYHVFYKVKHKSGETEDRESLAIKKFEVCPRTAQLKMQSVKDDKPLPNFQFYVFQGDEQVGGIQSTFPADTLNAKGETVPAGTAEFNLEMKPGFSIRQAPGCEIDEQTVSTGRKREAKGDIKVVATFVMPKKGNIKQYVNLPSENKGLTGKGPEVLITVGVAGDEDRVLKIGNDFTEIHFRATFGPADGEPVVKSARDDTDHATKVLPAKEGDTTATIEEKTAGKKYQGKVTLPGGKGSFKVSLGLAGGDTCTVEISGSDKFLTDDKVAPDEKLQFENWRNVDYEAMCAHFLTDLYSAGHVRSFRKLGTALFVEFKDAGVQTFNAMRDAPDGTLLKKSFLGKEGSEELAFVLTGRNCHQIPSGYSWLEKSPGRTLCIMPCHALLKWRKGTEELQAATKDYSATLTEKSGVLDMEALFSGKFMPFSGDDGGDGIKGFVWTADISKDDGTCKYTPTLEIVEVRTDEDLSKKVSEGVKLKAKNLYFFNKTPYKLLFKDWLPASFQITESGTHPVDQWQFTTGAGCKDKLAESDVKRINDIVDELLADPVSIADAEGKLVIVVAAPNDTGENEDACFKNFKDKLKEVFDAKKKDVIFHPGLDDKGEPRTGTCSLMDITGEKSNFDKFHYELGEYQADETPGPGLFIGPLKGYLTCPVKIEFSVQPHKPVYGCTQGKKIAWVCDGTKAEDNLTRLVLQAFAKIDDAKKVAHGHADGFPGDCLEASDTLCADCIAFGRSLNLASIP